MAVELFGPKIAPYATVACVISFLITGHRSVYPSQVLSIKKSSSLKADIGVVVEDIEPQEQPQIVNFQKRSQRIISKLKRKKKKSP
jgi:hypothetical protein